MHELPPLPYDVDALAPWIDERTMKIHYGKHHQGYVNKLNDLLKDNDALLDTPVEAILKDLSKVPQNVRQKVINLGGGVWNHTFFWESLEKDGGRPSGDLLAAIERDFGSYEAFVEQFSAAANGVFGSGWAWLVQDGSKLKIVQTANQDCPLSDGLKPLLTLDVWEHAYYILFQNMRADWVAQFWSYINWNQVAKRFTA